jgi:hypothetical protein
MSMTISIDNLRTALRDTNAKAAVAFAESYNSLKSNGITICCKTAPGDICLAVAPREGICVLLDE